MGADHGNQLPFASQASRMIEFWRPNAFSVLPKYRQYETYAPVAQVALLAPMFSGNGEAPIISRPGQVANLCRRSELTAAPRARLGTGGPVQRPARVTSPEAPGSWVGSASAPVSHQPPQSRPKIMIACPEL